MGEFALALSLRKLPPVILIPFSPRHPFFCGLWADFWPFLASPTQPFTKIS